ncbi:MAG: hypothetical protein RL701_5512 [Pseudomonadota bacterium]|jgi:hypothetical protein
MIDRSDRPTPFISPRSPSYERSRDDLLQPTSPVSAQAVAVLSRLCEAEQNALQICARLASLVKADAASHEARWQTLSKLVERHGGSAPTLTETREILAQSADAAAQAQGAQSDELARAALKTMHDELSAEYEAALQSDCLDVADRTALAALAK